MTTPGKVAEAPLAIVLAAGHGRRMGMPKALLELDGLTLVEHHLTRLAEVGCPTVVLVVRSAMVARLPASLGKLQVRVHVVAADTRSQAESLTAGTLSLDAACTPQGDDAVLVTPVDLLPPHASVFRDIHAELRDGIDAVTPTFAGKGGHPIVARVRLLRTRAAGAPSSLKDLLDGLGERRTRLAVGDPRVLGDLDLPSDLAAVSSRA